MANFNWITDNKCKLKHHHQENITVGNHWSLYLEHHTNSGLNLLCCLTATIPQCIDSTKCFHKILLRLCSTLTWLHYIFVANLSTIKPHPNGSQWIWIWWLGRLLKYTKLIVMFMELLSDSLFDMAHYCARSSHLKNCEKFWP